jgi:hypothetical protein
MKKSIIKSLLFISFSIIIFSCSKDDVISSNTGLDGYTKLKEGYAIGAATKVELWGKKSFFVGYNNVVVVLYDSVNPTKKITNAHIYLRPMMTMKHTCPVENPNETAVNEVFPGSISFIMASMGADNFWTLGVSVHNHSTDKEGEVNFNIMVDNPAVSSLSVFTSQTPDSTKYVLALIQPSAPKVGINDIEFTLNRKESMMSFPAQDSCSIEINPEMPSMGHGSSGNVNPVGIGNGHYKGKVGFSMTGEWKINVVVKKNGATISKNAFFNVTL